MPKIVSKLYMHHLIYSSSEQPYETDIGTPHTLQLSHSKDQVRNPGL